MQTDLKFPKFTRDHKDKLFNKIRYAFSLLDEKQAELFKRRNAERISTMSTIIEELKQKNEKTHQFIAKDKQILEDQKTKLSNVPETNSILKNKFEKIIEELIKRIAERESLIIKTNKRISSLEEDLNKLKDPKKETSNERTRRTDRPQRERSRRQEPKPETETIKEEPTDTPTTTEIAVEPIPNSSQDEPTNDTTTVVDNTTTVQETTTDETQITETTDAVEQTTE